MERETFKNPPKKFRMLQIIHDYYKEGLAKDYDSLGFGGVVANVSHKDYLRSEEGWETFLRCLKDFQAEGMLFWIYDERGYPSGKADGLTLQEHPEYEAMGVFCARTDGKKEIKHKLPPGNILSIIAMPKDNGKFDFSRKVDLSGCHEAGQYEITWTCPDDLEWSVMSFHIDRAYEGTHCVANVSDTLPYINIIDRDAVAHFINLTHEAYRKRCGAELLDYVEAFFTDEPSLMTLYLKKQEGLLPPVPWSRTFREDFLARWGYDIVPEIACLFVDCGERTIYRRLDFWKLVAELVEKNFFGQIQEWCHKNGTASSGHALCEEQIFWHAGFEGDLYRVLRRMDIPGIDLLSSNPTQIARANHIPITKFVSSVAHMSGTDLCMSETSSYIQQVTKQPCSFEQRIGTINLQFVQGLTRVTSYYRLDEFEGGQLRAFNDHIGRLGYMLTGGVHVADIAVFYPIHSFWSVYTPTNGIAYEPPAGELAQRINNEFGALSSELLANQRDFDFVDDEAILSSQIKNGRMEIAGESFCVIVLPNTVVIPLNVYKRIDDFVNSGGWLISLGDLPKMGMNERETISVLQISQRLANSNNTKIVNDIKDVISSLNGILEPDLSLNKPCRELFYLHRKKEGREIYFISNSSDETVEREITFSCKGEPELWHPTTGEIMPIKYRDENGRTLIKLTLKPFEGVILVF